VTDRFRVALSGDFKRADGTLTYPDFDLAPLRVAVLRIALDVRKDFGDWLRFVNKRCRSAGVMRSSLPVPIHGVPGHGSAVAQHWCPSAKVPRR
jgi:hypothetical protein